MSYQWRENFDLGGWLDAWRAGVASTWPEKKPSAVRELLSIANGITFTAPEMVPVKASVAWGVYCDEPETPECSPVGRAAVALTYILAESVQKAK